MFDKSPFTRSSPHQSPSTPSPFEDEDERGVSFDPSLLLRTVTTAHSAITESIANEARHDAARRKRRKLFGTLKRKGSRATKTLSASSPAGTFSRKSSWGQNKEQPEEDGIPLQVMTRDGASDTGMVSDPQDRGSVTIAESSSVAGGSSSPLTEKSPSSGWRKKKSAKAQGKQRSIYVNLPIPFDELYKGEPLVRYVRNKVRTSKYTILSFFPKNLYEQFRRVANIYFLGLIVLQVFPMFGASTPQIAMLPLVAVLVMTGVKDGLEDWRRARLDNEVNNSAATKLGSWKNVNQPTDPRDWFERLFGMGNDASQPSKGVQKLRKAEAKAGMDIVLQRKGGEEEEEEEDVMEGLSTPRLNRTSHMLDADGQILSNADMLEKARRGSFGSNAPSMRSRAKVDTVLDYNYRGSETAKWERTLWKKLEVGDIVLLREDEQIPADIVVLATSDADDVCFVETKNLDGETNLKIRKALPATAAIHTEEDLAKSRFKVECEPPHANLYTHNGSLKYFTANESIYDVDGASRKEKIAPITINELLLRGCTLRNTAWVIGLVAFTGADTKIMLNGGETPSKRSKIEKEMNFNVIVNLVILFVLCTVSACIYGYFQSIKQTSADYYEIGAQTSKSTAVNAIIVFASSLVAFQNIVPISLYISMDIVKIIQAFFISQDREMYYAPFDTACVPKSLISEDLGEVSYVMSDKTGTITANQMSFIKCSIGGQIFGDGITEAMFSSAKRAGRDLGLDWSEQGEILAKSKVKMLADLAQVHQSRYLRADKVTLVSQDLVSHLKNEDGPLRSRIIEFFRALAICQSVLASVDPDDPYRIDYKAESPDEEALVGAARDMGFAFLGRKPGSLKIEVMGRVETWIPLQVLEFTSQRKRMSVIARGPDGKLSLFCKGADSIINQRLIPDHDPLLRESTQTHLETFSNGGLRCLLVGHRHVGEEEYISWAKEYNQASSAIENRDEEIERACDLMEHSLNIIGATALEDKLQEGVPEAIRVLREAGIKIWLLTGDKTTTAIEIAYSANLLDPAQEVMIISADSADNCREQLEAGLRMVVEERKKPVQRQFAVVIDGDSLRFALEVPLKGLFLEIGVECSTVICCRVSPSQKAMTVRLVKEGCKAMTLAIGDGANDVAMIQEAHVGVGMFGLEGSQAAMSADYAIGQFRFLPRLLLVHGSLSYKRISDMIMSFFYKTIVWTLILFWFFIYNSFDGTYLYDYTFLLLYALLFTSLPVCVLGAFDQHLNAGALMAFPALYKRGIAGLEYTRTRFVLYMLEGVYQSLVMFYVPFFCYSSGISWSSDGRDTDSLVDFGTTVAVIAIVIATLGVLSNFNAFNIFAFLASFVSVLALFVWIPIYSSLGVYAFANTASRLFTSGVFWLAIPFTAFLAVGPRLLIRAFKQMYIPMDRDIVREAWLAGTVVNQSTSDGFMKIDLEGQTFIESEPRAMTPYPGDATPTSETGLGGLSPSETLPLSTTPALAALWQSSVAEDVKFDHKFLAEPTAGTPTTAQSPSVLYYSAPTSPDARGTTYPPSAASSPPPYQVDSQGSYISPARAGRKGAGWV